MSFFIFSVKPNYHEFICKLTNLHQKSNLHHTLDIMPKQVTSGVVHLRGLAPGQCSYEKTNVIFLYVAAYFSPYPQKAINALYRACIGVAGHLSTTPRWGSPATCLSQRHDERTSRLVFHTILLLLSVKQGSCDFKVTGFDPTPSQNRVYSSRGRRSYHSVIWAVKASGW